MLFDSMPALPKPSQAAQDHSCLLQQRIVTAIRANNGWIPFSRYMEMALYEPGLGYYMGGGCPFGAQPDFTTAPEMTALFAQTLADQLADLLPHCANTLYEFGAGSGILAFHLLQALRRLGLMPQAYYIVELSAPLAKAQYDRLSQADSDLFSRVHWLDRLPDEMEGVLLGNEVLDAMPCELIHWQNGTALQRGVQIKADQFTWLDKPINETALAERAQAINPDNHYISEVNLRQSAFVASLADRLTRGALLFIDYGFAHREYYHPQRSQGTLMGHYQQQVVLDPFFWPGLMDLTAHVDFTAIAQAGMAGGLTLVGYTTQAHFLINLGLLHKMESSESQPASDYFRASRAVQTLLSHAEMGELFKVMGWARDIPLQWTGFLHNDLSHML